VKLSLYLEAEVGDEIVALVKCLYCMGCLLTQLAQTNWVGLQTVH